MRLQVLLIASTLLSAHLAFAGAANGVLTCQSGSGRTQVKADFPVDMTESSLQITVDGKTASYINADMVEILAMNNRSAEKEFPGHQVAEMVTAKTSRELTMTAVRDTGGKFDEVFARLSSVGTLSRKSLPFGGEKIRFNAELTGQDPRDSQAELPVISVQCVYEYSI